MQVGKAVSGAQRAVAGPHGAHPPQHRAQQVERVLARDDGVRGIEVDPERGRGDLVHDLEETGAGAGELGVRPQPVLVVVLHDHPDAPGLRVRENGGYALHGPCQPVRLGDPRPVLAREHPDAAPLAPRVQPRHDVDHLAHVPDRPVPGTGRGIDEVRRGAHHRKLDPGRVGDPPEPGDARVADIAQEPRVEFHPFEAERWSPLDEVLDREPVPVDELMEEPLGERGQPRPVHLCLRHSVKTALRTARSAISENAFSQSAKSYTRSAGPGRSRSPPSSRRTRSQVDQVWLNDPCSSTAFATSRSSGRPYGCGPHPTLTTWPPGRTSVSAASRVAEIPAASITTSERPARSLSSHQAPSATRVEQPRDEPRPSRGSSPATPTTSTSDAPARTEISAAKMPTGPGPITVTVSPGRTRACSTMAL